MLGAFVSELGPEVPRPPSAVPGHSRWLTLPRPPTSCHGWDLVIPSAARILGMVYPDE